MYRLELVEKVRHILAVRDAVANPSQNQHTLSKLTTSGSRMNLSAVTSPSLQNQPSELSHELYFLNERQSKLCSKVISLIQSSQKPKSEKAEKPETQPVATADPASTNSSLDVPSPDSPCTEDWDSISLATQLLTEKSGDKTIKFVLIPEIEEVRLSQGVSKKGHILLMTTGIKKWTKHWTKVRRPYMFIYQNEKDPVESYIINLIDADVEYSLENEEDMDSCTSEIFKLTYKNREYWFRSTSAKEVGDWLYAIKPLLAGEIKSKLSRNRKTSDDHSSHS